MTAPRRSAPCREATRSARVVPVWVRGSVTFVLALFIALAALHVPAATSPADQAWAHPSSAPAGPTAPLAPDESRFDVDSGDNGDEAVELSTSAMFDPPYGESSSAAPPHGDPVGLDPPRVPPPEA